MSLLAQQQQALLALLFDRQGDLASTNIAVYLDKTWARGQKVYQSNGHALARSALRAAYPVVAKLLGDESFDALARALWHAQPPQHGDVSQWGGALAAFLSASGPVLDEPYLPDVATLEWALHQVASAPDGVVDAASFALLGEHEPTRLQLVLSPGSTCVCSAWPVVSIVHAHGCQGPSLEQAGQRLRACQAEAAMVWRAGLRPQTRVALAGEVTFVNDLLSGQPFGVALERSPMLEVGSWLPLAVQTGLLLGVRLLCDPDFISIQG
jgi:hypothetical protein